MKKKVVIIIVLNLLLSCKKLYHDELIKKDEVLVLNNNKSLDSLNSIATNKSIIEIGFMDRYENLSKLSLENISKDEYARLKIPYTLSIPAIKNDKENFYIDIKDETLKFKKNTNLNYEDGEIWYEYKGYYPKLDLYAITKNSVSESMGFGDFFFIDGIKGTKFNIISIGDGSVELPVPSPNGIYLAYYYNMEYEQNNSFIAILKINDKSNVDNYLKEYSSYNSNNWNISELEWADDKTLLIKGSINSLKNDDEKFEYYKAKLE